MTVTDPRLIARRVPAIHLPTALSILRTLEKQSSIVVHPRAIDAAKALRDAGMLKETSKDRFELDDNRSNRTVIL